MMVIMRVVVSDDDGNSENSKDNCSGGDIDGC